MLDHSAEGDLLRTRNAKRARKDPSEGRKRLKKFRLILRCLMEPGPGPRYPLDVDDLARVLIGSLVVGYQVKFYD